MIPTAAAQAGMQRLALVSQAWSVIRDAQEDLDAGVPVRHEPALVYTARGVVAEEFETTDIGAWQLVRETAEAAEADRAAFLAGETADSSDDRGE